MNLPRLNLFGHPVQGTVVSQFADVQTETLPKERWHCVYGAYRVLDSANYLQRRVLQLRRLYENSSRMDAFADLIRCHVGGSGSAE